MPQEGNHRPEIMNSVGHEPDYVARFNSMVEKNIFQNPTQLSELAQANPNLLISFGEDKKLGYYMAFRFKKEFEAEKSMPWHNERVASHQVSFRMDRNGSLLRTIEMTAKITDGENEKRHVGSKLGKNNSIALMQCLDIQNDKLTEVVRALCQLSNRDVSRVATAHHEIKQLATSKNSRSPAN